MPTFRITVHGNTKAVSDKPFNSVVGQIRPLDEDDSLEGMLFSFKEDSK